jgi:CRISPR-associated endoribonuclease Cas6
MPTQCAYAYIFETPHTGASPAPIRATNLPHPFVILPPLTTREIIHTGEPLAFQLTLIGKGIDFLPYFIYAFDELGRSGIGRGRGRYRLERVADNLGDQDVYLGATKTLSGDFAVKSFSDIVAETHAWNPQQIALRFLTPTRILDQNKTAQTLSFDMLIRGLLRRASLLAKIHAGQEWALDYGAILEAARTQVRLTHSELHDQSWEHYSNRQQRRMRFDSFIGTVRYEGELTPFLPFIQLGHYIHLGKNTTFGMGKYEVQ